MNKIKNICFIFPQIILIEIVVLQTKGRCCVSYEVTRSSNTIRVQLQMIQYIFQIKILSKDTPSFQRQDWLKKIKDTIRLKYDAA